MFERAGNNNEDRPELQDNLRSEITGNTRGKEEEVLDLDDLLNSTEDGFQQHLKDDKEQ